MEISNDFKCRASAAGKLMINPRNKSEQLSETTKTFVEEWCKEKIYGYRKEITSKEIEKGTCWEDVSIDKAIEWADLPFALKNTKRFDDEFFTGEPDIITNDTVIDIKNSWDCFTFPLFADEIPTKDYMYQVQVYMHLTGLKNARVIYILLDTPETKYTVEWTYNHVADNLRWKSFDFVYDEEIIKQLQDRVKLCREYINQIAKSL